MICMFTAQQGKSASQSSCLYYCTACNKIFVYVFLFLGLNSSLNGLCDFHMHFGLLLRAIAPRTFDFSAR